MHTEQMQEQRDRFLELLSELSVGQKGAVINYFLEPYRRQGITDPRLICRAVYAKGLRQLRSRWCDEADAGKWYTLLRTMKGHPDLALRVAEWAVWWDSLSPAEKDRIRAPQREHYRREYMQEQVATEKQLDYLRSLGHQGQVENRLHASELINSLLHDKSQ